MNMNDAKPDGESLFTKLFRKLKTRADSPLSSKNYPTRFTSSRCSGLQSLFPVAHKFTSQYSFLYIFVGQAQGQTPPCERVSGVEKSCCCLNSDRAQLFICVVFVWTSSLIVFLVRIRGRRV